MKEICQEKDRIIIDVIALVKRYADIVCGDKDYFKDDIISDCIVEIVKIVNGDINRKLSPNDIFNGWIKDLFDKTMKSYRAQRDREIPFSAINEEDDYYRDIEIQQAIINFIRNNNTIGSGGINIITLLRNI